MVYRFHDTIVSPFETFRSTGSPRERRIREEGVENLWNRASNDRKYESLTSVPNDLPATNAEIARCSARIHAGAWPVGSLSRRVLADGALHSSSRVPGPGPGPGAFVARSWPVFQRPRVEGVARSDYQGHCLCFIRPLSAKHTRVRL